jgi:membrane fusion protein (multidrug efflux system)
MKPSANTCAASLLGGVLLFTSACRRADPVPSPPPPSGSAPALSIVRAKRGPISRSIALPATLLPHEQAVLYAKVAGYLKTIRVDKGDSVHEGDLLAEIESPELVADLARQKAEVAVADAAYRRASEAQKKAPDLVMPQTVDDAKGKLDVAQATLERTETLLAYTRIRAPLSGIVMDMRSVRVEIPVPELEVPHVKVGLPVEVTVDELPGRVFHGSVTRFAYALDEASKTMTAEAELPNPKSELRPGMYVRVRIAMEQKTDALLIPATALASGKGQDFVFTVSDGRAKRIAVKAGFRDGTSVEILEGLAPDQIVVLAGSNPPTEGQPVAVVEAR